MVPVFVDVAIGTYNVDVAELEKAIGPKTKAIFLAHTLGNPYDLDAIMALVKKLPSSSRHAKPTSGLGRTDFDPEDAKTGFSPVQVSITGGSKS